MASRPSERAHDRADVHDLSHHTQGGMMAGRPTKLNDRTQTLITDLLSEGNTQIGACNAAGIAPATFYHWLERGEADTEADKQTIYSDFVDAVTRAIGLSEAALVRFARNAASKDGRVALEMLARRFPDRWATKTQVNGTMRHTTQPVGNVEVPSDYARNMEIAKVLTEIAVFGGDEGADDG
jgi:hypothetical protein